LILQVNFFSAKFTAEILNLFTRCFSNC